MVRITQVCILMTALGFGLLGPSCVMGGSRGYQVVKVSSPRFVAGVSMLGREQDEFASNLTAHAVRLFHRSEQFDRKYVRRMVALALHLSPQNEHAPKVNRQLAGGVRPKAIRSYYTNDVFAKLLYTRAKILAESHLPKDRLLGRYFLELSVVLNPKDATATNAYKEDLKVSGALDWEPITGEES